MKRILAVLLCGAMLFLGGYVARADVINFDELSSGSLLTPGYGGFVWSPVWSVAAIPGAYSSPNVAQGYMMSQILSGSPFYLNDAWFAALDDSYTSLQIMGFRGDNSVIENRIISLESPQVHHFGWSDVAALYIALPGAPAGPAFAMDNFRFNEVPVPEPAALLLLASGLAGLAGIRKRFLKN